jgi:hypothetical protein
MTENECPDDECKSLEDDVQTARDLMNQSKGAMNANLTHLIREQNEAKVICDRIGRGDTIGDLIEEIRECSEAVDEAIDREEDYEESRELYEENKLVYEQSQEELAECKHACSDESIQIIEE